VGTRQTRQMAAHPFMDPVHFVTGLDAPLGFCYRLPQSAALQMEYLSRAALQGPAYLQHLAAHG
jgi:hypothetical protein